MKKEAEKWAEEVLNSKEVLEEDKKRFTEYLVLGKDMIYEYTDKVPIKRGCQNKQCFCTGKCNEIIGWRDKLPNER